MDTSDEGGQPPATVEMNFGLNLTQPAEAYRIFWTISLIFYHSLAGPATYTQAQLI